MIGRTLGHYRIEARLGEGGMGVVYRAHDTRLNRPVALKVLPPDLVGNEERRLRFQREAQAAAALQPDSSGIQLELGLACEAAGKLDKAEAAYRDALRLDPKMAKAHYTLGTLLARTGRREEGASHAALYQAAFQAEQQATSLGASRKAELNLGWIALRSGQAERALEQFERHPDNADALRGAARALIQLGRDSEALKRYERAVALAPDDLTLRYELDREYDRVRKK